jgi:hypothetical protein
MHCRRIGPRSTGRVTPAAAHAPPKARIFVETGTQLWTETIPVCWWQSPNLPGDRTYEKTIIQEDIERTRPRVANVTIRWAGDCPTTGTEKFMAIELANNTLKENLGVDGQTGNVGMATLRGAGRAA